LLALVILVLTVSAASQWRQGHRERQLGREVAALAPPGDIHMLASESCAVCWMARTWFEEHKVSFSECMIETDAGCGAAFRANGAPGTPVVLVRGQAQVRFDPGQINRALQRRV
jgi:glutaredoxin